MIRMLVCFVLAAALAASDYLPNPDTLVQYRQALGLRDDQVATIRNLAAVGERRFVDLRRIQTAASQALDKVAAAVVLDAELIRLRGEELLAAEQAIKILHLETLIGVQAVLDPTQRQAMLRLTRVHRRIKAAHVAIDAELKRRRAAGEEVADFIAEGSEIQQCYQAGDLDETERRLRVLAARLGLPEQ